MRAGRLLACAMLMLAAPAQAELVRVPSRPGVTVPVAFEAPAGRATAWVLLMPGGTGALGLSAVGAPTSENSVLYLISGRGAFTAAGIGTVMVDTPSDNASGYKAQFRRTQEHADDIAAVVRAVRQRFKGPVWMLGHSAGAVSVANVARRLAGPARPDGLIMTSAVVLKTRRRDPDGPVQAFDYPGPVLIVANRRDTCSYSPPADAAKLRDAFTAARPAVLRLLDGGSNSGRDPCKAHSAHAFSGMHSEVLAAVAAFIRQRR